MSGEPPCRLPQKYQINNQCLISGMDGYRMLSAFFLSIMELKEISAGNLVMYKNQICRIIGFMCKDKMYLRKIQIEIQYLKNMLGYGFTDIDEVEPIKLTNDWLINFGFLFDKINSGEQLEQDSFYIENPHFIRINFDYNTKKYFLFVNNEYKIGKEFEFVHELQNICFALSGVELVCA